MKARIDYTNVPEALRGCISSSITSTTRAWRNRWPPGEDARLADQWVRVLLDVHSKDARSLGETEQRLYVLDAWEEAPFYSERERAALGLTEAVTGSQKAMCPTRSSSAHERTSTNRS